jgi:tetratricopeptide (TPR) repeat protein
MECVSVIITAHNSATTIEKALHSVAEAVAVLRREQLGFAHEVIVVDDGSTDDTPHLLRRIIAGQSAWQVVRRDQPSSPSCARNTGARQARGDVLFFLDGDDLFLPDHIAVCCRVLREGGIDFVKTGVRLASPVHPDWKERIENSIVINLAIRRAAHEAIGGFPDYHLFLRDEERLLPETDIFYKIEDLFYNRLAGQLLRGRKLSAETVEYCRHAGNAYDRQYEKFRRPFGEYSDLQPSDERFRLRLGEVILENLLPHLEQELSQRSGKPSAGMAALTAARRCQQAGDFPQAERLCREALNAEPRNIGAWVQLAAALHGRGDIPQAIDACQRALRLRPDSAEAHQHLGMALASRGQRRDAIVHLRQAWRLRPSDSESVARLGLALAEQGQHEEAVACFRHVLGDKPEAAATWHNLGVALAQQGRWDEAVHSLEKALQLQPDYVEALYNLGSVLQQAGRRGEAIARFRECLRRRPDHAGASNNLGLALTEEGAPHEAVVVLRQAVRLRPELKEAHNNLGLALTDLGRFTEAESSFDQALRLDGGYAEAHSNLGNAYKEQGRLEEALACYEQALRLTPDAPSTHYNRSLALLQKGDYEHGWPAYEWRWRRKQAVSRTFARPRWDGMPAPEKTILLWCEQGLGDTLQFVRYAALVKRKVGRVVLECPPALVPLLSSCAGVDRVVAEREALPDFDVQAPLMSLPALCGTTTLTTVPAEVPYLRVDAGRVKSWRERLAADCGLRIGLVWQGNPRHPWDRHRSVPLASLEPLARVEGVRLFGLQKGPGREQIEEVARCFAVVDLGGELDETGGAFLDSAAVMQSLDLVVSVDTAAAHLAGALGVPVWMALSRIADWRWLRERGDSPWYPSMRLFRQKELGDWRSVFTVMAGELGRLVATRRFSRIAIEVVPGELIDRITILEIKADRLWDPEKLAVVRSELAALRQVRDERISPSPELANLNADLRAVNEALWDSEDGLQVCERGGEFGAEFIELARSVYLQNDRRSALKQQINEFLGAPHYCSLAGEFEA